MRKKKQILVPRTMIPDAVFLEFPAKTLRKLTVSGRKMPEIRFKDPMTVSGCRF
jgi:hypothetical protein